MNYTRQWPNFNARNVQRIRKLISGLRSPVKNHKISLSQLALFRNSTISLKLDLWSKQRIQRSHKLWIPFNTLTTATVMSPKNQTSNWIPESDGLGNFRTHVSNDRFRIDSYWSCRYLAFAVLELDRPIDKGNGENMRNTTRSRHKMNQTVFFSYKYSKLL